jgi:hypothetical protein
MPDRKYLLSTLTLALLLALMPFSSFFLSGSTSARSRPDCYRRAFILSVGEPASSLSAAVAAVEVLRMKAIPCDDGEQDKAKALGELRVCFRLPWSLRVVPNRQLIAARSVPSTFPLRC